MDGSKGSKGCRLPAFTYAGYTTDNRYPWCPDCADEETGEREEVNKVSEEVAADTNRKDGDRAQDVDPEEIHRFHINDKLATTMHSLDFVVEEAKNVCSNSTGHSLVHG